MAGAIFQKSKLVTGSLTTISNRYFFAKKVRQNFLNNLGIPSSKSSSEVHVCNYLICKIFKSL